MAASQPLGPEEASATPERIRIGTAGWSYKDWEGIFYRPGMARNTSLAERYFTGTL